MTTQNLVNFSIQQALDRPGLAYLGKTKAIYFHFFALAFSAKIFAIAILFFVFFFFSSSFLDGLPKIF